MRPNPRLGLIFSALLAWSLPASAAPELVADLILSADVEGFGGFSGLELDASGQQVTAVSDKGVIMKGQVQRDASGAPTGVTQMQFGHVLSERGERMAEWRSDAEGLAIDAQGRIFVSFEGDRPRLWRYDQFGGAATALPSGAFKGNLQGNSSLEALAIDATGTLYTAPERSGRLDRPFPVFRLRGGQWDTPFSIPRRPPHLVVGMDFDPEGRLYVLERHFTGLSFRSRIRRFELGTDRLTNEETILETGWGQHTNLEGLAIWRDEDDVLRATMIADDNFNAFLSTVLVEYRFPALP